MELFYNPERMSETEIRETFVANQWLVDEILSIVKKQPKGAAVQHVVIVAPRGMGKTTLLLMLRLTVQNHDLAKRWQPVLFPEESYSVYDLADLWVEVLDHLASETGETELHEEVEKLKKTHPKSTDLEPLALAQIQDWHIKHKKRLLMLVDSLDLIFEQIGDEKDNASLRQVLMNDGTMMFVGASTTFFKEARAYDQPLYNFFKVYDLNGLNSEQIEDLLRRRAKVDGVENFEEILRENRTRLRVLEYFTGGNPRLVLMLYRVITQSQITEVRRGLEKLLDEVTPYYKAKIETLPPQQRKILDQIARISAQTREGLTPTEIAAATRLGVNQISSQLKRLADDGYVRAANIRGRSSYYTLSEPLYAIWHQMRFGRDARMKMNWLVTFLKGWYDAKELGEECQRLEHLFGKYLNAGLEREARDALEHRRYLMEAIEDQASRVRTFESILLGYLELSDLETVKTEMLASVDLQVLSVATRQRLVEAGLLTQEANVQLTIEQTKASLQSAFQLVGKLVDQNNNVEAAEVVAVLAELCPEDSANRFVMQAWGAFLLHDIEQCLTSLEHALEIMPELSVAWSLKGRALKKARRLEEAVQAFTRAVELSRDSATFEALAGTLLDLGRHQEALANYEKALEINGDSTTAFSGKARTFAELARIDEALSALDQVLGRTPDSALSWFFRGALLTKNGKIEEALKSFEKATELDPQSYDFVFVWCLVLVQENRIEEVLECVEKMLQLEPESADAYLLRGTLSMAKDFDAAVNDLKRSFSLTSSPYRSLIDTLPSRRLKVILSVITGEMHNIKPAWDELISFATALGDQTLWLSDVSEVIRFVAGAGHWDLAAELIDSADLGQPLFPLTRALEYLRTGDQAIIEKLSPEMRTIVDEIVTTLKKASTGKPVPSKKASRKKKSK